MKPSAQRIFFLVFGVLISGHAAIAGDDLSKSLAEAERLYTEPRTARRCPETPEGSYNLAIRNTVLGSTPQEEEAACKVHNERARITFDTDKLGLFSNLRFTGVSGLLDRDFWTLYAVASCPPIKALSGDVPLEHVTVENTCSTKEDKENRLALFHAIPRKPDGDTIFFTLIPASVVHQFPGQFRISEICQRKNIVGIPVNCLETDGKSYWSLDSANELISGHSTISEFLREWPQFYRRKPQPSKTDVLSFAESLRGKYKSLLKPDLTK